jgi:hypothetical protein
MEKVEVIKAGIDKCIEEHTKLLTKAITLSRDVIEVRNKHKTEARKVGIEKDEKACHALTMDLYEKANVLVGWLGESTEILLRGVNSNYLVKRAIIRRRSKMEWMIKRMEKGRFRLEIADKVFSFIEHMVRLRTEIVDIVTYHQSILVNARENPQQAYGWY